MKVTLCLIALFIAASPCCAGAQILTQKKVHRVALSIGNAGYSERVWGSLRAPVRDAEAVSTMFREAGFTVTNRKDLAGKPLRDAIDDFIYDVETIKRDIKRRDAEANEAIVALFFYSGHGYALDDSGYLPGVDADGKYLEEIVPKSYRLAQLVNALTPKDGDVDFLSVLMIDACRKAINLPSRDSGAQKGVSFRRGIFAEIGGFGRIAIFASTNGKASYDAREGKDEHSVFTEAIRIAAAEVENSRSFSQFVARVEQLTPMVSRERFNIRQLTEVSKVGVANDFPLRAIDELQLDTSVAAANSKAPGEIEVGYISLGPPKDSSATVGLLPTGVLSVDGAVAVASTAISTGDRLRLLSNPVVKDQIPKTRIVCRSKGGFLPSCYQVTSKTGNLGAIPKGLEVTAVGKPEIGSNGEAWLKIAFDKAAKF